MLFLFFVTPKNCPVKIIKKLFHKKVIVRLYTFGDVNF